MSEKVQRKKKGNVFIITGASGVKPQLSLGKFNVFLKQKKKQRVKIVDVEKKLVSFALRESVCRHSQHFQQAIKQGKNPIIAIVSLPYQLLRRIWGRAMVNVHKETLRSVNSGCNVAVVLHAVHFNPISTELRPIVDTGQIDALKPKCVVNLIDDVDDIYRWLAEPGGVLDRSANPEGPFEQIESSVKNLSTVLIWRQAEGGSSVHMAGLLGSIPHFTIATKHSCRLLEHVFDANPYRVYLSHPISEARRLVASGNQGLFDEWSREIGNLADHLSKELPVWEPTTIDELRIRSTKVKLVSGSEQPDTEIALPRFLPRWPFRRTDKFLWPNQLDSMPEILDPAGFFTEEDIAKIEGAKTWEEIVNLLGADKSTQLRFISGQIANLQDLIGQQINARDRTLVGQCPVLVAYRPLFNGNPATGVLRELQAHQMLVELEHFPDGLKPAVFVLENGEDERLLWRNTIKEFCIPKGRWSQYVREAQGGALSENLAQRIGDFLTGGTLNAKRIVNTMQRASQEMAFSWGPPKKTQSILNGVGRGTTAWMDFVSERINDLGNKVQEKMKYRTVLKKYKKGTVFRSRDIGVIDFAKEVIKRLKKID